MSVNENKIEWYVVNTYSGSENEVKANLEKRVETMGISDNLLQVLIAEEEIEDVKDKSNSKSKETKTIKKNLYPGYLFVKMIMSDEAWYVVRNTPGVTGFIGSSGGGAKPFPVSQEEMDVIMRRIDPSNNNIKFNGAPGDRVKIISGIFIGTEGIIDSINEKKEEAKLIVFHNGREVSYSVPINLLDIIEKA